MTTPADELHTAAARLRTGQVTIRPDLDKPLADWLDAEATRLHATAHPDWHADLAPHALTIARHINQE